MVVTEGDFNGNLARERKHATPCGRRHKSHSQAGARPKHKNPTKKKREVPGDPLEKVGLHGKPRSGAGGRAKQESPTKKAEEFRETP